MSINIFDFGGFPTKEQRKDINKSFPCLKELWLELNRENDKEFNNMHDLIAHREFVEWVRQFNNRVGQVKLSYIMSIYYYNMGIPDEEWNKSPGNHGSSVQYFHNFEEKHYGIKYFFNYYSDIFYYKIFGVWDSIYHLINKFYQINIQTNDIKFKNKLLKKLKKHNKDLYKYFENLSKNDIYLKAKKLRNDLTHNFPSNDIGPGVNRDEDGSIIVGVGDYVTSNEFKENMEGLLELLRDTIIELKKHFSL